MFSSHVIDVSPVHHVTRTTCRSRRQSVEIQLVDLEAQLRITRAIAVSKLKLFFEIKALNFHHYFYFGLIDKGKPKSCDVKVKKGKETLGFNKVLVKST